VADSSLAPYVITGIFTLVAGVGGSLGGVALAQKLQADRDVTAQRFQRERDQKADEREIRDRTAARLRENYSALLMIALHRVLLPIRERWNVEEFQALPAAEQQTKVRQIVENALFTQERPEVDLLLESELYGERVLEIFDSFNRDINKMYGHFLKGESTFVSVGLRAADAQKELVQLARKHLTELEMPL
jgi:hypothetical protein